MSLSTTQISTATPGTRYLELIQNFPLRPIRSDTDLEQAIAVVDLLIDRKELDPEETDYLEVLGGLIHQYEHDKHPLAPGTNAQLLEFLLENSHVTVPQLAQDLAMTVATIESILADQRGIEPPLARKLALYFSINSSLFTRL